MLKNWILNVEGFNSHSENESLLLSNVNPTMLFLKS